MLPQRSRRISGVVQGPPFREIPGYVGIPPGPLAHDYLELYRGI